MIDMPEDKKISVGSLSFDYRILLIIPVLIFLGSVVFLFNNYATTGEMFQRSIDLKGGASLTIKTEEAINVEEIESILSNDFGTVNIRGLRGFGEQGASIEMDSSVDYEEVMDRLEENGITIIDFSLENIGPALGEIFWIQAQMGIIIAFIIMAIVAFAVFRTFIPSIAIVMSAASDIIVTLAVMQIVGIDFSLASLGALLMLIGYSVDTDIMLTSRILREDDTNMQGGEKLKGALKTGLTMTLTSIGAVSALLIIPLPTVLVHIASVILIGLSVDIMNTWLLNSVMLRWYSERRGIF